MTDTITISFGLFWTLVALSGFAVGVIGLAVSIILRVIYKFIIGFFGEPPQP